jgi:hypothetical protein
MHRSQIPLTTAVSIRAYKQAQSGVATSSQDGFSYDRFDPQCPD